MIASKGAHKIFEKIETPAPSCHKHTSLTRTYPQTPCGIGVSHVSVATSLFLCSYVWYPFAVPLIPQHSIQPLGLCYTGASVSDDP